MTCAIRNLLLDHNRHRNPNLPFAFATAPRQTKDYDYDYLKEDMMETFRRYIPKTEVEALKADLAERTVKESETQGDVEVKVPPAVSAPDQADSSDRKEPQGHPD